MYVVQLLYIVCILPCCLFCLMEGLMAAPVSGVDAKYLSCLLLNLAFILKERITHKSIIIYFNDSADIKRSLCHIMSLLRNLP